METKGVYKRIRLHSIAELQAMASEIDGTELFIDGQWITNTMLGLFPHDMVIDVEAELDYYVWTAGGEQWRIQAKCVQTVISDIDEPMTIVDPWATTDVSSNTVTTVVNPFEDTPKVYKKKPKSPNKFPVEIGDLVLVSGLAIPQVVMRIINDGADYKVEVAGSNTPIDSKQVFPFYALDMSGSTPSVEIGDLIETQRWGFVLVVDGEVLEKVKQNGGR